VNATTAEADLNSSIPHELTHLLLYQIAGTGYENVPLWLRDGVAAYIAQPSGSGQELSPAIQVTGGETVPIEQLCQTGQAGMSATTAAQGESLVRYIATAYGETMLRRLIGATAVGGECAAVLEEELGTSLGSLQESWRTSIQPVTAASSFFAQNILWLGIVVAGFMVVALMLWRPMPRKR
jgi:hypothetical protein